MLKKRYTKRGVKVTFEVDYLPEAEVIQVAGDFNDWQLQTMQRFKNGKHKYTVDLQPGREYAFRYFIDGRWWENEWEADRYRPNGFGEDDSIVAC